MDYIIWALLLWFTALVGWNIFEDFMGAER